MPFFIILFSVLFFTWIYFWRRLVVASKLSPRARFALTSLFVLLLAIEIVVPLILRQMMHSGQKAPPLLYNFTFGLLGLIDILLVTTLLKDLVSLPLRFFMSEKEHPGRRLFLTRSLNLGALAVAGGAAIVGTETALALPEVKRVVVPKKELHKDLDQLTIVQISDLHAGGLIDEKKVRYIVDTANALKPDLVVLTGDIGEGKVGDLLKQTQPLLDLRARYGKFYVTGNHEYYWDVDEWTDRAQSLGFDYLYNTHRVLKIGDASLVVGGVADYMCTRNRLDHVSDPIASAAGAPPSDYKILLAHQPKSCFLAYRAGYDLQLSGHTHYGQFFPNSLVIRFFHPYVKGLNLHEGKMYVYVNVGTGFWGPPQRLGVPAEITHLTLSRT